MFGSQILEVAIGLVFVYLMFSLICSGLKEWIHHILNVRSKTLEEALHRMLGNKTLVDTLYSHQLIDQTSQAGILTKTINDPVDSSKTTESKYRKPHDISKEAFAKALLDSILKEISEKGITKTGQEELDKIRTAINSINNDAIKKSLTNLVNDIASWGSKTEDELTKRVEAIRKEVENWFDTSMQKLSEWYRQKTKKLIFVLGFILIIIFNVDTLMMVQVLSKDPQVLATTVSQAQFLVDKYQTQASINNPSDTTTNTTLNAQLTQAQENLKNLRGQLVASGLPMGWAKANSGDPRAMPVFSLKPVKIDVLKWLEKLLGLLISIMAVSMGAPFWFDALKQLFALKKKLQNGETQTN